MKDTSKKECQRLKAMIEAGEDVTSCVALYLDLYEDTDVMHRDIVENEVEALRAGDEENNMEAGRLELMLRDNPDATYFDYYEEEPITIEWLRVRLGMGKDPKKAVNLLKFLQNWNIIRIRDNEEFNRFGYIMLRHGLSSLMKGWAQTYPAQVFQTVKFNKGDRLIETTEWDGKTFYAECQIGKESIGIYPYTYRATVEWYGAEPMSVDDIDDKGI